MAITTDSTGIVNMALDLIKTENINNVEIPSGDKSAIVAKRWYDETRRGALESFPWIFASTRASIPLSATAPAFGFTDGYTLPNDYLSLGFIELWYVPLSQYNYMLEGNRLLINNSAAASLDIGYVYNLTQVVKFTPAFKKFLAYSLAEVIVFKLSGNRGLLNQIITGKKVAEVNARAINGKANPPVAFRQSRMLNARRRFAGSASTFLSGAQNGRS